MPRTLRDLLIDGLRDAYSAEQQLLTALPEMVKAASTSALSRHLAQHAKTTAAHVSRLCAIFERLDEAPEGKVSLPMEGLVRESQKLAQEGLPAELLDAALVGAAQKISHYEVAAYGTLCGYAEALGERGAVKALKASLADEKKFTKALSELARGKVNPRALSGDAKSASRRSRGSPGR